MIRLRLNPAGCEVSGKLIPHLVGVWAHTFFHTSIERETPSVKIVAFILNLLTTKIYIMQSVRRAIKRGNAILAFNFATKGLELVNKRGTETGKWNIAVRDRAAASEQEYMDNITLPLSHGDIIGSRERFIFKAALHEKKSKRKTN